MYALVFHMPQVFGIPADQTALSGTVVFNTFVLMQLVNQVTFKTEKRRQKSTQQSWGSRCETGGGGATGWGGCALARNGTLCVTGCMA